MSERYPGNVPAGDLPWHDVPADSDVVPRTEEPDPAEVEGDEGEEVDVSHPPTPDISAKYRRESLDERLAEEVPDRASREQDPEAWDDDDHAAEEAAVHVRSETASEG